MSPLNSKVVGVIGAGLIGRAWAILFARAGLRVQIYDADPQALDASILEIEQLLQDMQRADLLVESPAVVLARIHPVASLADACRDAVLIQENIRETVEAKTEIFTQLDLLADPATVLASSTSWLPASSFTESLPGRARCLVAHPANPPYLIPLVEVAPAPWTDDAAVGIAMALYAQIGQEPVLVRKEVHGFLLNRVQGALLNEMLNLYEDGYASADDLDKVMKFGLGLRWSFMGPFETIDLNAPEGIVDYVARYGQTYTDVSRTQKDNNWNAEVIARIEAERRALTPADDLQSRARWRDNRLMALRQHQNTQPK
jgi:3-hydroxyacyl-CoA dehydrogenase